MFNSKTLLLLLAAITSSDVAMTAASTPTSSLQTNVNGVSSKLRWNVIPPKTTSEIVRSLQEEEEEEGPQDVEEPAEEEEPKKTGKGSSVDEKDDIELSTRSGEVATPTKRECSTEQSRGKIKTGCKAKTDDGETEIKDEIKFEVRANPGEVMRIKVEYETEIETDETETETETQYTLVFDRMIEYKKSPGSSNEYYQWGEDEVVKEMQINQWNAIAPIATDGNLLTFAAVTEDNVATFTFTIAQSETNAITANKMKIDFLLENYQWTEPGTYVALVSHIETEREVEIESDNDDEEQAMDVQIKFADAVDTIGFVPFGEFTWAETAEATTLMDADGTNSTEPIAIARSGTLEGSGAELGNLQTSTISVIASKSPMARESEAGTDFQEIAYSFTGAGQGAARIYWDPEAGVGYTSSAFAMSSMSALAIASSAFGLLALL